MTPSSRTRSAVLIVRRFVFGPWPVHPRYACHFRRQRCRCDTARTRRAGYGKHADFGVDRNTGRALDTGVGNRGGHPHRGHSLGVGVVLPGLEWRRVARPGGVSPATVCSATNCGPAPKDRPTVVRLLLDAGGLACRSFVGRVRSPGERPHVVKHSARRTGSFT